MPSKNTSPQTELLFRSLYHFVPGTISVRLVFLSQLVVFLFFPVRLLSTVVAEDGSGRGFKSSSALQLFLMFNSLLSGLIFRNRRQPTDSQQSGHIWPRFRYHLQRVWVSWCRDAGELLAERSISFLLSIWEWHGIDIIPNKVPANSKCGWKETHGGNVAFTFNYWDDLWNRGFVTSNTVLQHTHWGILFRRWVMKKSRSQRTGSCQVYAALRACHFPWKSQACISYFV